MLRIYGRMSSLNTQKVMLCVHELALAHVRIDAGRGFGVTDTPAFLAMNPNGLIPVIEDAGFVLWESNAIIRYLAAQHAPAGLWPQDVKARAQAESWMDWQQCALMPAIHPHLHSLASEPARFAPAQIEAARIACESLIAMLDARLALCAYVGGETFSMADCALLPPVHRWLNLPMVRASHPALEDWYRRCAARPAAIKALP